MCESAVPNGVNYCTPIQELHPQVYRLSGTSNGWRRCRRRESGTWASHADLGVRPTLPLGVQLPHIVQ